MLDRIFANSSTDESESSDSFPLSGERRASDRKTVLDVLGKKYSAEIVAAATDPISANELSKKLDIPPATCYRRVEELIDVGLLRGCENHGAKDGVKHYRRSVDKVDFNFDGELSIRTSETSTAGWTLDKIWSRIVD